MKKKSKLRIAKFISNAGISSRRGAEKLILEGKVEVNGQLIKSPALNINKDDIVKVDGRIIEYDLSVRMWIFYKPKGCLVTASDPKDRKTIYDILPHSMKNINAVGRLDFNSEGLLLLTNNGDFSRYLELPKNNFERLYKVRVFGKVRKDLLLGLSKGIKIDGIRYKPIKALLDKENGSNSWLKFSIASKTAWTGPRLCSGIEMTFEVGHIEYRMLSILKLGDMVCSARRRRRKFRARVACVVRVSARP